jgi:tetratricopeptide (TPR) repeat protein
VIAAISRAAVLKTLIESGHSGVSGVSYEAAVISCSERLIEVGSPQGAVELIEAWASRSNESPSVRLSSVLSRAKLVSQDFEGALALITRTLRDEKEQLSLDREAWFLLRIHEGAVLRHLNRAAESTEMLKSMHAELLSLPDSQILGWCAYQLANTEMVRGDRRIAKQYVLEALVSARRSKGKYLEANALQVLAMIERFMCRWSSAYEAASESVAVSRDIDANFVTCHALRGLAITALK